MELYSKNVNYSVFDGEITLHKKAQEHLLRTLFRQSGGNLDILLNIQGVRYKARLMNVPSSSSVQISYAADVQKRFQEIFPSSYVYCISSHFTY